MNHHFNAHRPSRFAVDRSREPRYPFLTALDCLTHWFLCACVLISVLVSLGLVVSLTRPDLSAHVGFLVSRLV